MTLIEESRGDKSIPVVPLAKPQANVDLTIVLHFGYLHRVILLSVQVVCRVGYFSFVCSLRHLLQCQKKLATFPWNKLCDSTKMHFILCVLLRRNLLFSLYNENEKSSLKLKLEPWFIRKVVEICYQQDGMNEKESIERL